MKQNFANYRGMWTTEWNIFENEQSPKKRELFDKWSDFQKHRFLLLSETFSCLALSQGLVVTFETCMRYAASQVIIEGKHGGGAIGEMEILKLKRHFIHTYQPKIENAEHNQPEPEREPESGVGHRSVGQVPDRSEPTQIEAKIELATTITQSATGAGTEVSEEAEGIRHPKPNRKSPLGPRLAS